MAESIIRTVGIATVCMGALIALAILFLLASIAWIAASRKWRAIFRAESNILDYLRNRVAYEHWKKEQEARRDAAD